MLYGRCDKKYGFKRDIPIGIEVKPLSDVEISPWLFRGPAKATFYQIIWVSEGSAVFNVDFRPIEVRAGEFFIISVNQVYCFDVTGGYEGRMILFTEDFFSQSEIDTRFLHTSEILTPHNLNRIVRPCDRMPGKIVALMEQELRKPADPFQSRIAQSLLLEAERTVTHSSSPPLPQREHSSTGRRFCHAVEKHFRDNHRSDHYRDLLAVTDKTLTKEVRLLTGKNPKKYIDERIVLEAKRLLSYSRGTVKEISIELGFDEPTNFNKFFRKYTGTTPLQFRNIHISAGR